MIILGCPTTPIKGGDSGRIAASVEEALASLTSEMVSSNLLLTL